MRQCKFKSHSGLLQVAGQLFVTISLWRNDRHTEILGDFISATLSSLGQNAQLSQLKEGEVCLGLSPRLLGPRQEGLVGESGGGRLLVSWQSGSRERKEEMGTRTHPSWSPPNSTFSSEVFRGLLQTEEYSTFL